jgi:hypothetical protein
MNNDKAKAEILDWCSQRVECLARRKIIDEVGTLDAAQTSPVTERDPLVGLVASLAAAISLLERTPKAKKAAPSDTMFEMMLSDYRKALEAGRQFVQKYRDGVAPRPSGKLPDCMMPDGAEPCIAFTELYEEVKRLRAALPDTSTLGNSK